MSIWTIMNYVAYGISGLFIFFMLSDFIKVERGRQKQEKAQ